MQYLMPPLRSLALMTALLPVLLVVGCVSTSTPANVSGLGQAVNLNRLATTQGKTVSDQANIDATVARGCAIGIVTGARCDRHTDASDDRLKELGL